MTDEELSDPEFQARLLFMSDEKVNALVALWALSGRITYSWKELEMQPAKYDVTCLLCGEEVGRTTGHAEELAALLAVHNRVHHFVPALRREFRIEKFKQDLLDRVRAKRTTEEGVEVLRWSLTTTPTTIPK